MAKTVTVGELIGRQSPVPPPSNPCPVLPLNDVMVGIEVEVEHCEMPDSIPFWTYHSEGSLHNEGAEYVLESPLMGEDIPVALQALYDHLDGHCQCTPEGSVHVHIDVRSLSPQQLLAFYSMALLMEDVLFKAFFPDRYHNSFCQRFSAHRGMDRHVTNFLLSAGSEDGGALRAVSRGSRYYATNMLAVTRFGSLEFRGMHSTIDPAEICRWVAALLSVLQYSAETCNERKPWAVHLQAKHMEPRRFFETVLSGMGEGIPTYDPAWDAVLRNSINNWRRVMMERVNYLWEDMICVE